MSLTFVHTADWHLGHVYRRLGPRASDSARWRLDAVHKVFDLAVENKASFVLVAGDVFDTDTPSREVMRAAVELLRDAPVPVHMISGNHDPCAEGSVWFHQEFADALKGVKNVQIATAAQPIEIDEYDTVIFPCPVTARHTSLDTTSWIPPAARGSRLRIGLAHGGWRGYYGDIGGASAVNFNEIDSTTTDRCGLDYLALGDYHSFTPPDHPAARARTYYAGTPECGASDDARPGHALLVKIDAPGADPQVEPQRVGRVQPHNWGEIVLRPGDGLGALEQKIAAIEDRDNALVRANVTGCVSEAQLSDLQQWIVELRDRVLGADIGIKNLYTEPTDDDFATLRLESPEQRILNLLEQPLARNDLIGVRDAEYIANWSGDEAARREARNLFYQLLRDAR